MAITLHLVEPSLWEAIRGWIVRDVSRKWGGRCRSHLRRAFRPHAFHFAEIIRGRQQRVWTAPYPEEVSGNSVARTGTYALHTRLETAH